MIKNGRVITAGENEFYRWGKKAVEKVKSYMKPNSKGYYSIPADGRKYWTFGTSIGKYGEFARFEDTCFSINKGGYLYAKEGTEKGKKFVYMLNTLVEAMHKRHMQSVEIEEEE